MNRLGIAAIAIALSATACGGDGGDESLPSPEPAATESATVAPESEAPSFAESDECRTDAALVLEIVGLALEDTDVRDVAGRMDTLDGLLPDALALCTSAVARPTNEAVASLNEGLDAALSGRPMKGSPLVDAYKSLQVASVALDAAD